MFDAVDEAIRNLLIKEIPVRQNEIEIVFDQPTQEWSARVGNPTLNIYLHEIRENRQLRGAEQFSETQLPDGTVEIRRNPVRIDLHYLVTAWSKKEEDQHHLLGLAMVALLRNPFLPDDVCPEALKGHPVPIPIEVSHTTDETKNWSDFWTTMNNRLRPGLTVSVTLLIDPYRPVIAPIVQTSEVRFAQKGGLQKSVVEEKVYWKAGGEIITGKYDPSLLTLIWEEKGVEIPLENGHFLISKIEAGTYHLAIRLNDRLLKRHKFTIPPEESLRIEI